MTTYKSIPALDLLSEMGISSISKEGINDSHIHESEKRLNITFPRSYYSCLKRYGVVIHEDFTIFGLGVPPYLLPSVVSAVTTSRAIQPEFPANLIPIHSVENGVFACIYSGDVEDSKVVLWLSRVAIQDQDFPEIADTLNNYILQLAYRSLWREQGEKNLRSHVIKFQAAHSYEHASGGDMPKNHEWRPYRYCIQDVLFGATVVRHSREHNRLEVDVFLTADIPEYGPLAGAGALAAFLLSEAYKCGGSMELQFTPDVENGQVPWELQKLASMYGVEFQNAKLGNISSQESRIFYGLITKFSEEFMSKMKFLEESGKINLARACYVIHHGVWSKEQVEMIVLGSNAPDRVLGGFAQPIQRNLYYNDLLHARAALLGGALDRMLMKRERISDKEIPFDIEDDIIDISISFDGGYYAKTYQSNDEIVIPWLYRAEDARFIQPGRIFCVLIRARSSSDLLIHIKDDFEQAAKLRSEKGHPTFLLVPADFAAFDISFQDEIYQKSSAAQIGLLINPDPVFVFDAEATQKIARSRILRQ